MSGGHTYGRSRRDSNATPLPEMGKEIGMEVLSFPGLETVHSVPIVEEADGNDDYEEDVKM